MILSLGATVPLKVTVVVVEAVSFMTSAVVVISQTEQAQPLGAVAEWPIFTVVVQLVAPAKKSAPLRRLLKMFQSNQRWR